MTARIINGSWSLGTFPASGSIPPLTIMPLKLGTRLGPYEVIRAIGVGGMGEVYRARDTRLERDIALKVLPEEFWGDRERLRRFEKEARAAAALSHPNVLVVYDVGADTGVSYVVTELLDGGTLRDRLRQGAIDAEKAVELVGQVLSGLSATHARSIIHRDLKPENIFITHDGQVKILDFGLAKDNRPPVSDPTTETALTDTGLVLGTLGYVSPEQLRGLDADVRADIFSIGAILYEMLSGRRAFKGDSYADTICAILEKDPPPLTSFGVTAPHALLRIVARCLEKEPTKRFHSATDLKFALESSVESTRARSFRSSEKSIAVLAFANMSSTSDQEYFSDGLAEELINALAQLPGLHVASRSSSFRFRGSDLDIREIGKKLGVESVLEGSVRRSGNRLRVTVQLISVADGYHIWSERYDREIADVFAIQDEITQSIVQKLEPRLLGNAQPVSRRHTDNPEAFELYLKGRHFWHQRTESSLRAGITCFTKAVELDPNYALAHAGLADSFSIMRPWGYVNAAEARERTEAAASKAMQLDPTLAEAHFAMGLYRYWLSDDWHEAEPYLAKAVELQPRSSMMLVYYGNFLSLRDRFDDAARCTEKALEIDPLSPYVSCIGALTMVASRRYEYAIDLAQRALGIQPDFALGLYALGLGSCLLGQYDRAIEAFSKLVSITNRASVVVGMLGSAYALAGRTGDARILLDELMDRTAFQYVDPIGVALIYIGLGDLEGVERQLGAVLEQHGAFANVQHILRPLLGESANQPRFQNLFQQLRLPQQF